MKQSKDEWQWVRVKFGARVFGKVSAQERAARKRPESAIERAMDD